MEPKNDRRYWLWVTRPEYYLDGDGSDRESLDPENDVDSDGWWTCNKATKEGDLVFLWRTSPKKDIGYLIQAESDAYSIADDNDAGWDYGCDYQVLYKFKNPVHIKDLRKDPYFDEWGALRCSFQRSSFEISYEYWTSLNQLAAVKNPGYQDFIEQIQKEPIAEKIWLEKQIEEALANNLKILSKFGYDVELYVDPKSKVSGRQYICKGNGGRIDLLCLDKFKKRFVVIELKNVRASQNTFGQISNYMGWVQEKVAKGIPVFGLVISRGYDTKFESALKITDRISQLNVEELGFAIAPQKFTGPKGQESSKDKSIKKTQRSRVHLKRGNSLSKLGKYDEAIQAYDEAIKLYPKRAMAWNNKGLAFHNLGKYAEANEAYEKAIEIDPKFSWPWCNKALALGLQGKYDEAIRALDEAIWLDPKLVDAWYNKGFALHELGKYDEAIQAYDEAIKLDPEDAVAWNNKGYTFNDMGKYDEAIQALNEAIRLDPKLAMAWNNKGFALHDLGNYDEAIQAYDEAIRLDPEDADAWNNKGAALKALGRTSEANAAYAKARELGWMG